jgi:diguanylate cyclase (GGDEF)-like protein
VRDAHRFGRSLALAVVDVDGLDDLVDRLDREAADAVLGTIAQRLSDGVGSGSIHRLGAGEFVLVLSGATADDAEMLLGTLHAHDREDEIGGLTLSAGITELVERDGAQTALGRAEHALWQAKQAGRGTVVVAVPGGRKPPLE